MTRGAAGFSSPTGQAACALGSALFLIAASAPEASTPGQAVDRTGAEQVGSRSAGGPVQVEQVGSGSRVVPAPRPVARNVEAAPQVGRANDRTTAAPASGSSRADGRPTASVAIGGADRCDPQAAGAANRATCANPIETRAGQYRAPDPTVLSPEQRLAIARQAGDAGTATAEATRLAKAPEAQSLNTTEQGVASLVLNGQTPPPGVTNTPTLQIDPAALDAVIQLLGNSVPPR